MPLKFVERFRNLANARFLPLWTNRGVSGANGTPKKILTKKNRGVNGTNGTPEKKLDQKNHGVSGTNGTSKTN